MCGWGKQIEWKTKKYKYAFLVRDRVRQSKCYVQVLTWGQMNQAGEDRDKRLVPQWVISSDFGSGPFQITS